MSTTAATSNSCPTPSKRSSGWLRVVVVVAAVIGLYAVDGPSKGQVSASDAVTNLEKPMNDTAKVSGLGANGVSGLGVNGVAGLSGSGVRK